MAVPLRDEAIGPDGRRSLLLTAPPHPAATAWVECAWTVHPGWDRPLRLLPDARVDLVWNGTDVAAVRIRAAPMWTDVDGPGPGIGVRLRCGAAAAVLGAALLDAPGSSRPLLELVPRDRRPVVQRAQEALARNPDADVLHHTVVALANGREPDAAAVGAAAALPRARISDLADTLAWSERTLRRKVRAAIGRGPRELARVLRFQRFVAGLGTVADGRVSLAGAAIAAGYADQSHLGRECRALSGSSPARLVAAQERGRNAPDARPVHDARSTG